ncbi:hypothetical protein AA0472_0034 [Acetobacter estunensis NRIC 0472]|nr:hypothetical protein AA0472_0034 [Acetobacter estunensis NRIC 0472]
MFESRTVEIDGTFVGTIILDSSRTRPRFHAIHESVRSLHNRILDERNELLRQAAIQFRRSAARGGHHAHTPA